MKSCICYLALIVLTFTIPLIQNSYSQGKKNDSKSDTISRWKQGQIYEFSNPYFLKVPGFRLQFDGKEKVNEITGKVFGQETRVLLEYTMNNSDLVGAVKATELYKLTENPEYEYPHQYLSYVDSSSFNFWLGIKELSDIKFLDIEDPHKNRSSMSIRGVVEREKLNEMGFTNWFPLYYHEKQSEIIFWAGDKLAILDLQTGIPSVIIL